MSTVHRLADPSRREVEQWTSWRGQKSGVLFRWNVLLEPGRTRTRTRANSNSAIHAAAKMRC